MDDSDVNQTGDEASQSSMEITMVAPLVASDPLVLLEDLFRTHAKGLTGLARLLVDEPGAAEEVVQDAFVGLHRNWRRLRDPGAAPAYLRSSVINGARSRRRRKVVDLARLLPPSGAGPDETTLLADERRAVALAVRRLPRRQRECVVLRYYVDLSEAEIASTLSVSAGSVKTHLHRGLAALGVQLEDLR
jgi:RNA polymerase sigma-70 factor (sigma-E family)